MIKLNNNIITCDDVLKSTSNIIHLKPDKTDIDYSLVLILSDGETEVYDFTRNGSMYSCNVEILDYMIDKLSFVQIKVIALSGPNMSRSSNTIHIHTDTDGIKKACRARLNDRVTNLVFEIRNIKSQLESFKTKQMLKNVTITNQDFIKEGMVPVATGEKGNFVARYPFSDLIKEVNGVTPIDSKIELKPENIKFSDTKSLKDIIDSLIDSITSLHELTNKIIENNNKVAEKLDNLLIDFNTHINSGLI